MHWLSKHKLVDGLALASLVLVLAATSWSLVKPGFFWIHDPLHAARMGEMLQGLKDGHYPVRWSQNFGYGYGVPLFEFYAPLPYFVGALFLGLGLPLEWSFKILFLIPSLVTIAGAYGLGRRIMGRAGGVLLATLFALAPYRAVNLFVRGAVSESWAMMTFPWIIFGGLKLLKGEVSGRWIFLAAVVALILSHNITTLLFLPLGLGFTLVWWLSDQRSIKKTWRHNLKPFLEYVGTLLLAMGISSFYLWPALLEKGQVAIEVTTNDYYHFANHFLYLRQLITPFWGYGTSIYGPNDGLSFFLGWGMLLGLVSVTVIVILKSIAALKSKYLSTGTWLALVSGIFFAICIALTSEKTAWLWNQVPLLAFTQFPWRFLSLAAVFGAVAIVFGVSQLPYKKLQLGLMLTLLGITLNSNVGYFQPREFLPANQNTYFTEPEKIKNQLGDTLLEYLPTHVPPGLIPATEILNLPAGTYQVVQNKVQTHSLKIEADQAQNVTWQVAAYPGWVTSIDQKPVPYTVTSNGLMSLAVPAGSHTLELNWGYTTIRLVSDTITLVSLVGLAFWILSARKVTKKPSSS